MVPAPDEASPSDTPKWTRLPPYIRTTELLQLDQSDLEYLASKGVFDLLPPPLQELTLSRYAEYLHPLTPAFRLNDVTQAIKGNGTISLALYHAIMCAGLSVVETEHVTSHFASKPEARRVCYRKAKLLLDLEADADRATVCAASLLLINAGTENKKDSFFWAGSAVNEALSMQLSSTLNSPSTENRRLWWVVVFREIDVCLSLGRLPRISIHGLRPPVQADFHEEFRAENANETPTRSSPHDAFIAKMREMLCMRKAQLALIAYDVLHLGEDCTQGTLSSLAVETSIALLNDRLQVWFGSMRSALPLIGESEEEILTDANKGLLTNSATVLMSYWLVVISLHRIGIASVKKQKNHGTTTSHLSAMCAAASNVLQILDALERRNLILYVPATGVAVLCAAVYTLITLCTVQQDCDIDTEDTRQQLDDCVKYLEQLGDMNFSAQRIVPIVKGAVGRAKTRYPQRKVYEVVDKSCELIAAQTVAAQTVVTESVLQSPMTPVEDDLFEDLPQLTSTGESYWSSDEISMLQDCMSF